MPSHDQKLTVLLQEIEEINIDHSNPRRLRADIAADALPTLLTLLRGRQCLRRCVPSAALDVLADASVLALQNDARGIFCSLIRAASRAHCVLPLASRALPCCPYAVGAYA